MGAREALLNRLNLFLMNLKLITANLTLYLMFWLKIKDLWRISKRLHTGSLRAEGAQAARAQIGSLKADSTIQKATICMYLLSKCKFWWFLTPFWAPKSTKSLSFVQKSDFRVLQKLHLGQFRPPKSTNSLLFVVKMQILMILDSILSSKKHQIVTICSKKWFPGAQK